MKSKVAILIAATVSLSALGTARAGASAVYTYTGNDFTFFLSPRGSANPYTTSDRVTASIVLSTALGDNLAFMNVAPTSFSISDGVNTITQASGGSTNLFKFSTNASGRITDWNIDVENGPSVTLQIATVNTLCIPGSIPCDLGEDIAIASEGFNFSRGKWAGPNQPIASTPLPAALPLFATGLGAMVLFGWRKKRKAAPAIAAA